MSGGQTDSGTSSARTPPYVQMREGVDAIKKITLVRAFDFAACCVASMIAGAWSLSSSMEMRPPLIMTSTQLALAAITACKVKQGKGARRVL